MSHRLNKARQEGLEPQRVQSTKKALEKMGFEVKKLTSGKALEFTYKGELITFWPYSGWHTGKSIKEGRGFKNLLEQLK